MRRGGEYKKEGYKASTRITFESKELERYRDLWIAIAGLTAVSVESVTLTSSKEIEVRKKTRILAIEAACEKAELMAGVLKMEIGDPLSMSQGSVSRGNYSAYDDFDNGAGFFEGNKVVLANQPSDNGGSGIAPGTIPIRAKVEITFKLVSVAHDE